jgi:hypothetical protein
VSNILMAFSLAGTVFGLAAFGYLAQAENMPIRQRVFIESRVRLLMVVFLVVLIGAALTNAFIA